MLTSDHEAQRQTAQGYANWASTELSLPSITVALGREDGDAVYTGFGQLIVFRPSYLAACDRRLLAFAVFHEVGHIYAAEKQATVKAAIQSHGEEYVADYVGGWLLGKWGFPIHEHPFLESNIATVTDGVGAFNVPVCPFPVGLMLHLNLDETESHPSGGRRVTQFVINAWCDALAGNHLPF